jgi:hypothetical protein
MQLHSTQYNSTDNALVSLAVSSREEQQIGEWRKKRKQKLHQNNDAERGSEETQEYHECAIWTLRHCYFVNMGGFIRGNKRKHDLPPLIVQAKDLIYGPLDSEDKADATRARLLLSKDIREDNIKDKSKADVFVKILWIVQMLRLGFELCTRASYRYPITPLEILTVSFSFISLLMVLIQVRKPQDVGKPIAIKDFPVYSPTTYREKDNGIKPRATSLRKEYFPVDSDNALKMTLYQLFHVCATITLAHLKNAKMYLLFGFLCLQSSSA